MTPTAVLADDYFTSSSATTSRSSAQVLHLGAMSPHKAETCVGRPEDVIDYDLGASVLLRAADVEEATSSSVSSRSPFGI